MIEFRINGEALHLFPGTSAEIEERHPIVSEDLADAFTFPLEIPVERNEAALGHVHELRLAGRKIRIDGVEMRSRSGYRRGVFYVEGSSDGPGGTISVSFSVNGFVSGMADKRLREVDFGPTIEFYTTFAMRADAELRNTQVWPDARYCYPSIFNPEAYNGNNKDWVPEARAYDAAQAYTPGQKVLFTRDEPVRRERMFECLGPGASPGQNPDNTPAVWAPWGYGIINSWNAATAGWRKNIEATGNWSAMSPQFYLKDVLIRAMKQQGLNAVGDFFDDPRTHSAIVYNNQLLDAGERAEYLLASQTTNVTWYAPGPTYGRIVCQNDNIAPNLDPGDRWHVGTGAYTPTIAGLHHFRLRVKFSSVVPCWAAVEVYRISDSTVVVQGVIGNSGDLRQNWDIFFNCSRHFTGGDLTEQFAFRVLPRSLSAFYPFWQVSHHSITLSQCFVEAWIGPADPVNDGQQFIVPAQHVPDITIEHLLLDVRDTWHVRITPLPDEGVVRFDYQVDFLYDPVTTDITQAIRGPIALDHAARTTGIRLKSPTGRVEDMPDLSAHFDDGDFNTEAEVPAATAEFHKAYVRNTGQLLGSRLHSTNQYAWFVLGTLCRDAEVGDMTNPREVAPEFGPPPMDLVVSSDHSICLMPVIEETCSSGMFGVGNNEPGLYFMYYKGMQPNALGHLYPLATGFARNQDGAILGLPRASGGPPVFAMAIHFDPADSYAHYSFLWRRWAELLAQAEVYVTDIDMSKLLGRGRSVPLARFLLHNQVVLFDTLNTRHDDAPGPPIAEEVRLLRLPYA